MTGNNVITVFGAVVIVIWPGLLIIIIFFSETLHIVLTATIYYILNSNLLNSKDVIKAGILVVSHYTLGRIIIYICLGLFHFYKYFMENKNFWHGLKCNLSFYYILNYIIHWIFIFYLTFI